MFSLLCFATAVFIFALFLLFRLLRAILTAVSEIKDTLQEVNGCLFTTHADGEVEVTIANTLDIIRQDAKGLRHLGCLKELNVIHQELKEIKEVLKNKQGEDKMSL